MHLTTSQRAGSQPVSAHLTWQASRRAVSATSPSRLPWSKKWLTSGLLMGSGLAVPQKPTDASSASCSLSKMSAACM